MLEAARQLRVQVVPSVDLEHDLTEASLFIYITRAEGLGSAILLAMSAGVPVIASAVGGIPEAIRAGEDGLLVENDSAAIAGAIANCAEIPRWRDNWRSARVLRSRRSLLKT